MEPKRKLLIFSLAYYPKHVGGAEVAIKEITDRLSPERYEVHLIANRYDSTLPTDERIGNVTVHRIGFAQPGADTTAIARPLFYGAKIMYVPLAAWVAWRLHRQHAFDAFWCMMLYMTFPVALLRLAGLRLPYAVTLQEGDTFAHVFGRWYIKLASPLLTYGLVRATVVQSISTYLSGWAGQRGYAGRRVVIPNGVDVARFTRAPGEDELRAAYAALGKRHDDVFLVTTSRLVPKNGVDTIVRTLPLLPAHVKLAVFGTGPEEARLRALAAALNVRDRVQLRGHVEHAELSGWLHACDIFVRPSRSEGMGNSFIEAMAAGLPVIATQVGGIADFLFDAKRNPDRGATGWAVDVGAPAQIRDAVTNIITEPERAAEVTARAKAMVVAQYDWDLVAARMEREVFEPLFSHP